MTRPARPIPPVERSTTVPCGQDEAFRRFTADFGTWWPRSTLSVGGDLVRRIVFEPEVGGRIFEELVDGRRFQWGRITAWEPPRRVAFSWHPSKDESRAQDVTVSFVPEGDRTRVVLVSAGWERLGPNGARARRGYGVGWGAVLAVFAGRRSVAFAALAAVSRAVTLVLKATGRLDAEIEKAGGRMPASPR